MIADGLLAIISSELGKPYAVSIGTYVVSNCSNEKHPEKLAETIELLANAMPGIREDIMTLAQQLEHRGLQQGLQQTAQKMLKKGIPLDEIEEITGIPRKKLTETIKSP